VGGQATVSAPAMSWTRLTPGGTLPSARYDHTLVTDGSQLYLFGGRGPDPSGDLWIYDIAANTWEQLNAPAGPSPRFGHNADVGPGRMLAFGGQNGNDFFADTWELGLDTGHWQQLAAGGGPAGRYGAAACLDDAGHFLVTHGFTATGRFDDTWQLDLATSSWTDVSSSASERPAKRCLIDGAWDTRKRRLIIYGGQSDDEPFMDDLWGWSPEFGWQQVAREPRPSPRNMYALAYNAQLQAATLIGGRTANGQVNDTWFFSADGETWAQAAPQGEPPAPRYGHDAAIMPDGSIYLFGGTDGTGTFDDLWRLDIS
jgi:hypothetical protein